MFATNFAEFLNNSNGINSGDVVIYGRNCCRFDHFITILMINADDCENEKSNILVLCDYMTVIKHFKYERCIY
jgi:hypothetical protein